MLNRRFICMMSDGRINYAIPGVMTFAPLYCSIEEFVAHGGVIPDGILKVS